MKERIVIFGGSGHAKLVIDIIEKENKYTVLGIIDDLIKKGTMIKKYPVLGDLNDLNIILNDYKDLKKGIIAVGDNYSRLLLKEKITSYSKTFSFISTVHPSAIIGSDVTIGKGTVIAAGVLINNDTKIGDHCYLAFKSAISHDSTLGNFSSLGPGVTTGGNVKIGNCTAIGLGANIVNDIEIGNHSMVGSGSLVVKNVDSKKLAIGVPARCIREREIGEKYL